MTDLIDDLAHETAELLVSTLLTYEGAISESSGFPRRTWLYIWEKNALLALDRYMQRETAKPINLWVMNFLLTNLDNIKYDRPIDWNLKAAREKREANGSLS